MSVHILRKGQLLLQTLVFAIGFMLQGLIFSGGVAHATTMTQCWYDAVPSGYAVTAIYTSSACGSDTYNTYTDTTLSNGMTMCSQAMNPPTGWVATSIGNTATCGPTYAYGNEYAITSSLTSGMTMCSQATPIPSGWVVTATGNSGTCDESESSGNQYQIKQPSVGLAMCIDVDSPPAGWTYTTTYNSSTCGASVEGGNTAVLEES